MTKAVAKKKDGEREGAFVSSLKRANRHRALGSNGFARRSPVFVWGMRWIIVVLSLWGRVGEWFLFAIFGVACWAWGGSGGG